MTRWEYRVIYIPRVEKEAIEAEMNPLGAEGWEFVCAAKCWLYFKRAVV